MIFQSDSEIANLTLRLRLRFRHKNRPAKSRVYRELNSLVGLDELLRPLLLDLQLVEEFPFPLPDQINRLPAFRDFTVPLENPSG